MRVDLGRLAVVRELRVQFQGGFAGRECELKAGGGGGGEEDRVLMQFYPSDTNSLQVSQRYGGHCSHQGWWWSIYHHWLVLYIIPMAL